MCVNYLYVCNARFKVRVVFHSHVQATIRRLLHPSTGPTMQSWTPGNGGDPPTGLSEVFLRPMKKNSNKLMVFLEIPPSFFVNELGFAW